jgi:serine/threonine-protein kinase
MGTPDFMAPEQAMGKHVDHRADIYSLGACAYALLTGRPPFEGANEYDVIYKQLNDDPAPPSAVAPIAAGMPKWLDKVILKTLRKDPQDRYASMRELGQALREGQQAAERGASPEPDAVDPAGGTGREPAPGAGRAGKTSPLLWVAVLAILGVLGGVGYTLLAN